MDELMMSDRITEFFRETLGDPYLELGWETTAEAAGLKNVGKSSDLIAARTGGRA